MKKLLLAILVLCVCFDTFAQDELPDTYTIARAGAGASIPSQEGSILMGLGGQSWMIASTTGSCTLNTSVSPPTLTCSHIIRNEGEDLLQQPYLNFVGNLVNCHDDAGKTTCDFILPENLEYLNSHCNFIDSGNPIPDSCVGDGIDDTGGGGGGVPATDVQVFTVTGASTWTMPVGAKVVEVLMVGGGGGGGSGSVANASTSANGGGGGGGASFSTATFDAAIFPASCTVTVGAGGAGGTAQTTDNSNGVNGTVGANSTFSCSGINYVAARGGPFGGGAIGGPGAGGGDSAQNTGGLGYENGTRGGTGGTAGAGGSAGTNIDPLNAFRNGRGAAGGGGGGSKASGGATAAGAVGGNAGTAGRPTMNGGIRGETNNTGGPGAGTAATSGEVQGGAGGGGTGGCTTTNSAIGGAGGIYGGGGGGSGGVLNGFDTGAGGAGANGIVIIITYF